VSVLDPHWTREGSSIGTPHLPASCKRLTQLPRTPANLSTLRLALSTAVCTAADGKHEDGLYFGLQAEGGGLSRSLPPPTPPSNDHLKNVTGFAGPALGAINVSDQSDVMS